jgi:hypothetical protein
LLGTLGFLVALKSCEKVSTTKWKCIGLYTIEKSYSRNNNSHLKIHPNSWSFFMRYNNAMWSM